MKNQTLPAPLGHYALRLQQARDDERARIARDLHDVLGGTLAALKIEARITGNLLSKRNAQNPDLEIARTLQRVNALAALADEAIDFTRNLIADNDGRNTIEHGLVEAVEEYARIFSARTNVSCTVSSQEDIEQPMPAVALSLFRVFQEALTNVMRHAHATHVIVRLRQTNSHTELQIIDDGAGFNVNKRTFPGSFGIRNMRERMHAVGGALTIKTAPGKGTHIHLRVANVVTTSPMRWRKSS